MLARAASSPRPPRSRFEALKLAEIDVDFAEIGWEKVALSLPPLFSSSRLPPILPVSRPRSEGEKDTCSIRTGSWGGGKERVTPFIV